MTVNTLEVFLIVSDELCYEPLSSAGGGCGCCLIYNWTEEKKKRTELSWIWTGQMWKRSEERGGRGGGGLLYNIYLFCGVLTLNVLCFFSLLFNNCLMKPKLRGRRKSFRNDFRLFQIISYVTCLSLILKQFQFHWEMRHSGTSGKGKHISISTELTCLKKNTFLSIITEN